MTAASPLESLIERFRAGERGALARVLSLIENRHPASSEILDRLYRDTGRALTIGITGPPGGGKSTLVNALIREFRSRDKTIAVIAIDPSSAISGGAALGDRIRMLENWDDDGVYVRSMATRGALGGLALGVVSAMHVLDAFGFDVICIETVGVGQGEIDIAKIASTTLLVQVPGLGDSIQLLKAGVLEIADILVVNKSDRPEAGQLARELQFMVRSAEEIDWRPPVVRTIATDGSGLTDLMKQIHRHQEYLGTLSQEARQADAVYLELQQRVTRELLDRLEDIISREHGQQLIKAFQRREISPTQLTTHFIDALLDDAGCRR